MSHLIFGIVWTVISGFVAVIMYSGDAAVRVNGEFVSQEVFNEMLWPKLFIGLFLSIGIAMILVGLKKILTNLLTKIKGVETYGLVIDIARSGTYVNGRPELMAFILVPVNDEVNRYSEIIGFDWNRYRVGDFVLVKHYKNDVNIIRRVNGNTVPYHIQQMLIRDIPTNNIPPYEFNDSGSSW